MIKELGKLKPMGGALIAFGKRRAAQTAVAIAASAVRNAAMLEKSVTD